MSFDKTQTGTFFLLEVSRMQGCLGLQRQDELYDTMEQAERRIRELAHEEYESHRLIRLEAWLVSEGPKPKPEVKDVEADS